MLADTVMTPHRASDSTLQTLSESLCRRCLWQDIDEDEGVRAVHEAFKLGINYFDTSPFYGGTRSETVSGTRFKCFVVKWCMKANDSAYVCCHIQNLITYQDHCNEIVTDCNEETAGGSLHASEAKLCAPCRT